MQVEAMLGKFSLDTMMNHGGQAAGLFMIIYLFTMIVMVLFVILAYHIGDLIITFDRLFL